MISNKLNIKIINLLQCYILIITIVINSQYMIYTYLVLIHCKNIWKSYNTTIHKLKIYLKKQLQQFI